MKSNFKKNLLSLAVLATTGLAVNTAQAGATITFGEDKSITAGFGFIANYSSVEDAAANGSRSNDFNLFSSRLYLSGSLNKYIKGMLNTERSGDGNNLQSSNGNVEVIDANVQLQVTPEVAIWAGRFLPPSDRANMAGPYYSSGGGNGYWANISSRYGFNGGVIGRDEGVAVVSSLLDDHLAISFGAFEGSNIFRFSGVGALSEASGRKDRPMYAGRVQYAFWDSEPGYYGTGNYFGAKDILTVGISGKQKSDGAVSEVGVGDYTNYSIDFLLEKKNVGPGTLSLEAAYYDYDTDKVFTSEQGKAYYVGTGYLFNQQVGWGKFMPFARYQEFDADNNVKTERIDVGVNYVIAPYNALISAEYQKTDISGSGSVGLPNRGKTDAILVSMQFQF
jgi:hypothetical protein